MRTSIRFLLGKEARTLSDVDPTRTVLDYLREDEGLCGTKEGCAEGDCGACTVLVSEQDGRGGLRHRPVNSCIMFVSALDGKQITTVEHLRSAGGALHPVQQAMLEHHASQCGFCTPGFVMSLAALYREGAAPRRAVVADSLAGNLCRCTGYRPIQDAARTVLTTAPEPAARLGEDRATAAQLAALGTETDSLMLAAHGRCYHAPRSLTELTDLLAAQPEALILGGGTDIGLWVTKQQRSLPLLISTEHVPELRRITQTADHLVLGSAVPYADAFTSLTELHPAIAGLLRRIGSRQIRERGTIGGNIANASPIGDMPPLLIALGAVLVLRGRASERRIAIEDFFLGYRKTARAPDEVLAEIEIPRPLPATRLGIYKVSKRFDQDISAVAAGFALQLDDGRVAGCRIGYGGMAAVPVRATAAEAALLGETWSMAAAERAVTALGHSFTPLTDMRASAAYRSRIAGNLFLKFYLEHPAAGETPLALRLDQPPERVPA